MITEAMTNVLAIAGRILLSVIFIGGGYTKFITADATQAYIAKAGLPMPVFAWGVAVFVELGLGLALLTGLFTRASAAVLAAWCVVTAAIYHSNFADHNMEIHFLKNVAMCGGLLYVVALGAGAFSLDALFFRRRPVALAV